MKKTLLFLISVSFASEGVFKSELISVGPQVHYYFQSKTWSVGLEASFWYFNQINLGGGSGPFIPYSWNIGYEWANTKQVLYTELQTTYPAVIGLSAGPAWIFPKKEANVFSMQYDVWWAFFGGVDFRYRGFDPDGTHSFGGFGRILIESDDLGLVD